MHAHKVKNVMSANFMKGGPVYAVPATSVLSLSEFVDDRYSGKLAEIVGKRIGAPVKITGVDSSKYRAAMIYFKSAALKKCTACGKHFG